METKTLRRIGDRRGPKRKFSCDDFIKAVKVVRSFSSLRISEELGIDRTTVQRFKNKPENKPCLDEAEKFLEGISDAEFTVDLTNLNTFRKVPIVEKWNISLVKTDVSEGKRNAYIGGLMHLCKHLDVHPSKLTLEDASRVNVEMREINRAGDKCPYGLSYARLRESIRSFFKHIHKTDDVTLAVMGVTKEELPGSGSYAHQLVSQDIRHEMDIVLPAEFKNPVEGMEAIAFCHFAFATAGRSKATLEYSFKKNLYNLTPEVWKMTFSEKGRHGGKPWNKYLVGPALQYFKEYCSRRFNIPFEDLEAELPKKAEYLFPSFVNHETGAGRQEKLRTKVKRALIKSGLTYEKFPPLHIWRHTFAQEFLHASGWKFESCASLGGWATTHILKKHYGKMGDDPLIEALKIAQGINEEKIVRPLVW